MISWFRNWNVIIGTFIITVFVLIGFFAPFIAPYHYAEPHYGATLESPSLKHLFGTDRMGRDTFSRVIYGTRTALISAFSAAGLAGVVGISLGMIGGYFGGKWDRLVQSLIDINFSFPTILLAIALVVVLQPGQASIVIAIVVSWWPYYARLVRGEVLATRKEDFVEAARALGSSHLRIIWKEILPNTIPMIVVVISITMGQVILIVTLLSFLGLGVQPPKASWGMMLSESRDFLGRAPWLSVFPGVAISLVVLGFNMLGDGVRDQLDPYLRSE
ncbi:MAG: ABC transporter permease [Candidatus Bipolaricaulia bacterium]